MDAHIWGVDWANNKHTHPNSLLTHLLFMCAWSAPVELTFSVRFSVFVCVCVCVWLSCGIRKKSINYAHRLLDVYLSEFDECSNKMRLRGAHFERLSAPRLLSANKQIELFRDVGMAENGQSAHANTETSWILGVWSRCGSMWFEHTKRSPHH